MWMFPHQQRNLLRYGHTLFLDGQKKQFNEFGWPYIGPVIKDSEFKVQTCAESICIEESIKVYAWIVKSMCEIESRFNILDFRIIYADQLISDAVLVELGIQDTCTLRCDYYHLLEEDWPKYFLLRYVGLSSSIDVGNGFSLMAINLFIASQNATDLYYCMSDMQFSGGGHSRITWLF
jgi:hypothetical protein